MIHLSIAVGEFFRILLTAIFTGALGLLVKLALATATIAGIVVLIRAMLRRRRD